MKTNEHDIPGELPPLPATRVIGRNDLTMIYGYTADQMRDYARSALGASTRTASEQEIVTAGERMARWLSGLSQSESMPESWRTTCAELAQAWQGVAGTEVNAGAARQGGNTCKESPHLARTQADAGKDAARWRAFRARDEFENLDFTAFQDQFREDADKIIDDAMLSASAAHSAEGGVDAPARRTDFA